MSRDIGESPLSVLDSWTSALKTMGEDAVPARLVTRTTPLLAPGGTVTVTFVGAVLMMRAETPPTVTPVTSDRSAPLTVSFLPGAAAAGLMLLTSGYFRPDMEARVTRGDLQRGDDAAHFVTDL